MRQQIRQKKRLQPIFSRPLSRSNSSKNQLKTLSSVALPVIHTKHLRNHITQVIIQNQNAVRKQIGQVVTFKKGKITCLQSPIYQQLSQQIQAVSYNSPKYSQKLNLVNKILNSCDLHLKQKDIMVAEGRKSQSNYIFFTNFTYHPQSLCCQKPVILKCTQKRGIQISKQKASKIKLQIICTGCFKTLLKLKQESQYQQKPQQNYEKRRRLLDFSLHIASGRYKKHLLEDDPAALSFQHVKSRFSNVKLKKNFYSLN